MDAVTYQPPATEITEITSNTSQPGIRMRPKTSAAIISAPSNVCG